MNEDLNGYICFHLKKGKMEVYANTSFEAQKIAATKWKIKKSYEVTAVLAEKKGVQVVHSPMF
jgi:hypothetical protein